MTIKPLGLLGILALSTLVGCGGSSNTSSTPIVSTNQAPQVDAGTDQTVEGASQVNLVAVTSDSDGQITSYQWTQTQGPAVELVDNNSATSHFIAPTIFTAQLLSFTVTVTDDDAAMTTDSVNINVNPTNMAPVYVNGLQGSYKALNGTDITLGPAQFTDVNGHVLTLRYFIEDEQNNRSYLDDNRFTCSTGVTYAGVQASDGELVTESPLSEVACTLSSQQNVNAIIANKSQLSAIEITEQVSWFNNDSLLLTFSFDKTGNGAIDWVVGIADNCEQNEFSTFNESPILPANLAEEVYYNSYPQYVICLGDNVSEQALVSDIKEKLMAATVADMLVQAPINDSINDLYHAVIKIKETGRFHLESQSGGFLVLAANLDQSTLSCAEGKVTFSNISEPDTNVARLRLFRLESDSVFTDATEDTILTDCQITNSTSITNSFGEAGRARIEIKQIPSIPSLSFDAANIEQTDKTNQVVVGLIDNDELPDVATVWEKTLGWHRNLGQDEMADRQTIATFTQDIQQVLVADIDVDGNHDILVFFNDEIKLVSFDAQNGFSAAQTIYQYSGDYLAGMLFDANGDKRLDLIIEKDHGVYVSYNQPDGFTTKEIIYQAPESTTPNRVKSADFNNDGLLDLMIGNDSLVVLPINTTGGFDAPQIFTVDDKVTDFVVLDLNNDEITDVIINHDRRTLKLYQLKGDRLEVIQLIDEWYDDLGGAHSTQYSIGDLGFYPTSENTVDLLVLQLVDGFYQGHFSYQAIKRFSYDSQGNLTSETYLKSTDQRSFTVSNLGHGALADILMTTENNVIDYFRINANLAAEKNLKIGHNIIPANRALHTAKRGSENEETIVIVDYPRFDKDSNIVTQKAQGWQYEHETWGRINRLSFSHNIADVDTRLGSTALYYFLLEANDTDSDDDLDLLSIETKNNNEGTRVNLFINNGIRFNDAVLSIDSEYQFSQYHLKDVDNDGDTDFIGVVSQQGYAIFLNQPGLWQSLPFIAVSSINSLDLADLNGDNLLDILTYSSDVNSSGLLLQLYYQVNQSFEKSDALKQHLQDKIVDADISISLLDYDKDNDTDIILALNSDDGGKSKAQFNGIAWMANNGVGEFGEPVILFELDAQAEHVGYHFGDFNGDGLSDMVVADGYTEYQRGGIRIWTLFGRQNDDLLNIAISQTFTSLSFGRLNIKAVSDLNNDGLDDFLYTIEHVDSTSLESFYDFGFMKFDILEGFNNEPLSLENDEKLDHIVVEDINDDDQLEVMTVYQGKTRVYLSQ